MGGECFAVHDTMVATDIKRYGWHCLHVSPALGEKGCVFTYSIGFAKPYGAPEIAVFGMQQEKAHSLLSECATLLRNGYVIRFDVEDPNVLAGDYNVIFRPVRPAYRGEYFGTAMRYYADKAFTAAVMFLPDRQHRFPWEAGYDYVPVDEALAIV